MSVRRPVTTLSLIGWPWPLFRRNVSVSAISGVQHPSSRARRAALLQCDGVTERSRRCAVRPFGRLLASYTVNELGDSVGIVALASSCSTAPASRRPRRRSSWPRSSSRRCRPGPHRAARPAPAAAARCRALRRSRRSCSPRWRCSRRASFFLAPVLALGAGRRRARDHGARRSRAARSRRARSPARPAQRGQRADEPRLRGRLRRRRGARRPADRRVRASRRRCSSTPPRSW